MPTRHGAIAAKTPRIFERLTFRLIAELTSARKPEIALAQVNAEF
jgi:hypothetical protein